MIVYISGGVRSGKSAFAQKMALSLSPQPVYIATASIGDQEFAERVRRHQAERGPEWTTFECSGGFGSLPLENRVVVIDCVTLWLSELLFGQQKEAPEALEIFKKEMDMLAGINATFIVISNELGMGLHAETALGRQFTDLQGMANQYVSHKAEEAIFMVSGLPLYLKRSN